MIYPDLCDNKHIIMRLKYTITIIFAFVCLLASAKPITSISLSVAVDSVIVIDPFPGLNPGPGGPKSPAVVPISACYNSFILTVSLFFVSNLGEIEVEVMNTTTGGYDSGTIDTQFLYATVPITMGSGHYLILFTLPSGQRYKGELDI